MKSPLLTSSSNFGKYIPKNPHQSSNPLLPSKSPEILSGVISLKQNYIHESPFVNCKFDNMGNRLYLVDNKHTLIMVNLQDSSYSTLKSNNKVVNFTIDGQNSLSLFYVSPKSELFKISFDRKKPQKVLNLNMSKILAFERNYLRELLLVLDYKLLFLYDLTKKINNTENKIRSLKAGYNEVFTNACFMSNNRFIVLIVKNIEIRIIEIMNFKVVHQIKLPFQVPNLKIQVSYDSRRISLYGDCHIIFFIVYKPGEQHEFTYQLIEAPFLKAITQLKYTYQNDIIFLGSDQILYGMMPDSFNMAIPIFNQQYKMRMMAFDISLDCQKIAIVSNRNVYQLCFKKGIRAYLNAKQEFKPLEYRINGFQNYEDPILKQTHTKLGNLQEIKEDCREPNEGESNQFQYEDEDQSQEDISDNQSNVSAKIHLNMAVHEKIKAYPKLVQNMIPINPAISELQSLKQESKQEVNYIFSHLSTRYRDVCIGQNSNIIKLIVRLYDKFKGNYLHCLALLDVIFNGLSLQYERLEHYTLVLCPEIISIVEKKFEINFNQFYRDLLVSTCYEYLTEKDWVKLINWVVMYHENTIKLPIFVISMLKTISHLLGDLSPNRSQWEMLVNPSNELFSLGFSFQSILEMKGRIESDPRFGHLFKKEIENLIRIADYSKEQHLKQESDSDKQHGINSLKLEELIMRQQEIKNNLQQIQINRPH